MEVNYFGYAAMTNAMLPHIGRGCKDNQHNNNKYLDMSRIFIYPESSFDPAIRYKKKKNCKIWYIKLTCANGHPRNLEYLW